MNRIHNLTATSQDIFYVLDFPTRTRHVFIVVKDHLVEAVGSRTNFDPLIIFHFLENESNPDRDVSDLMLDCVCSGKGVGSMEVSSELLKALPGIDPSTITFGIYGKKKGPGESVYMGGIGFIVIKAEVKGDKSLFIRDDRLISSGKQQKGEGHFPEDYRPHGSGKPERKAKKKAEIKKPGLHLVAKRGARKKKWAKRKVSRPDVIKYFSKVNPKSNWEVTFKAMIKDSKYRDLAMDSRTGHKRPKLARIYSRGIDRLVNTTGQNERTVRRHIELMIEQKIIKEVWHGFKGQGYSRLEIPLNISHVFAWRRKPPD